MKWITRRSAHVDRTACPWLIRKFIDPDAEFVFVAPDADPTTLDGHTFDMRGAEYAHEDGKRTFQVMIERHHLDGDAALLELGREAALDGTGIRSALHVLSGESNPATRARRGPKAETALRATRCQPS